WSVRESEAHTTPAGRGLFDRHFAAESGDDGLRDEEAEARARPGGVKLDELVEDPAAVLRRDAGTGVVHRELQPLPRVLGPNLDRCASGCELGGVRNDVAEDLSDASGVERHRFEVR